MGVPHIQLPKMGMAGEYKIVARKVATGKERLLADWFSNLITDAGLDNVVNTNWKNFCHVGTGTLTPTETDTALQTPVLSSSARANQSTSNSGTPAYYSQVSVDYVFPVGAGTYTEVGISNKAHTDGTQIMFSRARIVDGAGNPTSITVLADEYLVVTYRIRMYPPLTDVTGTIGIGSDTFDYVLRARRVNYSPVWGLSFEDSGRAFTLANYSYGNDNSGYRLQARDGSIVSITDTNISGSSFFSTSPLAISQQAYVLGSHERVADWRIPFANVVASNLLGAIAIDNNASTGFGAYQIGFTPKVPKTVNIQLTFTLGIGWGRYVAP